MKMRFLLVSAALVSVYANAASDNTVQFQGEVSTQTCSVNINGNSTAPIVLLPTVATTALSAAKDVAGATEFTVNVTGCATTEATIQTVFAGNNITANGNLGNTGTAGDVSIQLLDSDGSSALSFTRGETVSTTTFTKAEDATGASQNLTAQYYAEGDTVTAGSVIASAQYSITYN